MNTNKVKSEITASQARSQMYGDNNFNKTLKSIYETIDYTSKQGYSECVYFCRDLGLLNEIYKELYLKGFNLTKSIGKLEISW